MNTGCCGGASELGGSEGFWVSAKKGATVMLCKQWDFQLGINALQPYTGSATGLNLLRPPPQKVREFH
eukprot:scaffold216_cov203-Pinguiococcus_pyrenoidosus.AAC.2